MCGIILSDVKKRGGKSKMEAMSVSQAMRAIKDERCCECRRQAKGLVYRREGVRYYCKRCLHEYMQRKELQAKEAMASSA
jgi:hypothetical protein